MCLKNSCGHISAIVLVAALMATFWASAAFAQTPNIGGAVRTPKEGNTHSEGFF